VLKGIPNYVNKVNDCENSLIGERNAHFGYICAQRTSVKMSRKRRFYAKRAEKWHKHAESADRTMIMLNRPEIQPKNAETKGMTSGIYKKVCRDASLSLADGLDSAWVCDVPFSWGYAPVEAASKVCGCMAGWVMGAMVEGRGDPKAPGGMTTRRRYSRKEHRQKNSLYPLGYSYPISII
jgi:hypothetical protein